MSIKVEIHGVVARITDRTWTSRSLALVALLEAEELFLRRAMTYGSDPDRELTSALHATKTFGGKILERKGPEPGPIVPGRIY